MTLGDSNTSSPKPQVAEVKKDNTEIKKPVKVPAKSSNGMTPVQRFVTKRIGEYRESAKRSASGLVNYIPFVGIGSKISYYVPGIIPKTMYKVTSGSGAGKTQFTKFLFVYQAILYAIKYKVNYKVVYFALEESKEEFIDGLFIHILRRYHGLNITRFELNAMSKRKLSKSDFDAIERAKVFVATIMEMIIIVDHLYTPTEMYNKCREIAESEGVFTVDAKNNEVYTPDDPNQLRLVITDHISLVEEDYDAKREKYLDLRTSMAVWHTRYQRKIITKKWGWAALNVQQQGLESENLVFNSKGDTVISKLIPSMQGLGDNKTILRDDYVIFGLFAPERFRIENYLGYSICDPIKQSLYDNFRSLHLIKNRFGTPNKVLPMYFDGSYNYFSEMPGAGDTAGMQKVYDLITANSIKPKEEKKEDE